MLWDTSAAQCPVHKQTFTWNSLHNATPFGHFRLEEIHDFRLPPRCKWDLRSSGLLLSVNWQLLTDMSRQTVGHMCKQNASQEKCLTIEDGTDGLSRNVGNCQSTLCTISEERRSLVDSRSVFARRFRLADEGNGQLRWTASVCYILSSLCELDAVAGDWIFLILTVGHKETRQLIASS
jgi:hypothetical protein